MPQSFSPALQKKIIASLLFLFTLIFYQKTSTFDFAWDDKLTHIHANKNLVEGNISEFWKKPYEGLYIPVAYTAWYGVLQMADKKNESSTAKSFHRANVLFHALNVVLVFLLLFILTKSNIVSLFGSILFSVHPLQVESVAWISELRGLLSAFFIFTGLLIHIYYQSPKKKPLISVLVFLCGVLAALSKPSGIIFPLLIILYDLLFQKRKIKESLLFYFFLLLPVIPLAVITSMSQPVYVREMDYDWWMRIILFGDAIGFYFMKTIFPVFTSASYARTPVYIQSSELLIVLSVLVLLISGFLIWQLIKRKKYLFGFCLLFFVICLLPVSGIVPFYFQKFSNVADRYMYAAMFAPCLALSFEMTELKKKFSSLGIFLPAFILLGIYSWKNFAEQGKWKNDITLFENTIEKAPEQPYAYENLGGAYLEKGRMEDALKTLNKGIELAPENYKLYLNRGNAYARLGNHDSAIKDFAQAIALKPDHALAWYNRSLAFYETRKWMNAWNDLLKAEELNHPINEEYKAELQKYLEKLRKLGYIK